MVSEYMARDGQEKGWIAPVRRLISNLMPADAHLRAFDIINNCVLTCSWLAALDPGSSSICCQPTASVAIRCSKPILGIFS